MRIREELVTRSKMIDLLRVGCSTESIDKNKPLIDNHNIVKCNNRCLKSSRTSQLDIVQVNALTKKSSKPFGQYSSCSYVPQTLKTHEKSM